MKLDIGGIMDASARDLARPCAAAVVLVQSAAGRRDGRQIEAGTIELTLHDIGGVDLAVKQYARMQNVSPDTARQPIVDEHQDRQRDPIAANPDAAAIIDALAAFIQTPEDHADAQADAARQRCRRCR